MRIEICQPIAAVHLTEELGVIVGVLGSTDYESERPDDQRGCELPKRHHENDKTELSISARWTTGEINVKNWAHQSRNCHTCREPTRLRFARQDKT